MQKSLPRYYIWYASEDKEIYAYTDDRELADAFSNLRKKSMFIRKKIELASEDLQSLFEEHPEAMLRWVTYDFGGGSVTLPLTKMEETTVVHNCIQSTVVDLPLLARIDPSLFTKEFQKVLRDVGYIDAWEIGHTKDKHKIKDPKPNYLQCFLYLYSDTIEWGKGGSIYENLCILSNKSRDG